MRPGPGLVVMALAFISGARRGSTSTSSKTTSLSPTFTSSFYTSSSSPTPSSLSSSSSSYTSSLSSNSRVSSTLSSVFAAGGVPTPIAFTASSSDHNYNYNYRTKQPESEHLRPQYDPLPAGRESLTQTGASSRTTRETGSTARNTEISAPVEGGDDNYNDDNSRSSDSFDLGLGEGLPVRFPSHSADSSTSFDADDILALVSEDDLLSQESLDRLTKLTHDKIGYINEEDYGREFGEVGGDEDSTSDVGPQELQPSDGVRENGVVAALGAAGGGAEEQSFGTVDGYVANLVSSNGAILVDSAANSATNSAQQDLEDAATLDFKQLGLDSPVFDSTSALTRINPWLSACDLAQPGTAPDLQGQCTAGTLPVAWVDEGPGPPTCPKSCEQLRLENNKNTLNSNSNNNKNTNDNKYLIDKNSINIKLNQLVNNNNMNMNMNMNMNTMNHEMLMLRVRRGVTEADNSNNNNNNNNNNGDIKKTASTETQTATAEASTEVEAPQYQQDDANFVAADSVDSVVSVVDGTTTMTGHHRYRGSNANNNNNYNKQQSQNNNNIVKLNPNHVSSSHYDLKYNSNNNNNLNQEPSSRSGSNNNYKQFKQQQQQQQDASDKSTQHTQMKQEKIHQEQQQQCLDYLGDNDEASPLHLCQLKDPSALAYKLRSLRLRHCCERNVFSALHTIALNATMSGGAKCVRVLTDIMELDSLATRITCELAEILFRFDCRQVYSLIHQCTDCKEAYRRWVCSTLIPYFAEQNDTIASDARSSSSSNSNNNNNNANNSNSNNNNNNYNTNNNSATTTTTTTTTSNSTNSNKQINNPAENNNKKQFINNNDIESLYKIENNNNLIKSNESIHNNNNNRNNNHNNNHYHNGNNYNQADSNKNNIIQYLNDHLNQRAERSEYSVPRNKRSIAATFHEVIDCYINSNNNDNNNRSSSSSSSSKRNLDASTTSERVTDRRCLRKTQRNPNEGGHHQLQQQQHGEHNLISTATSEDPRAEYPVVSELLKRSKRKVEFRKRRRIRPCLSVCQTVEQKCPYLLPADRAPALPTQYAGEPTFLCLDPNIEETGEQRLKSNNGPPECCYQYCGQATQGLCTYCSKFADTSSDDLHGRPGDAINSTTATSRNTTASRPAAPTRHVHNITLGGTSSATQQRKGSVSIALLNVSSVAGVEQAERLPYYAYYAGTFYYDDIDEMPHEPLPACQPVPSVSSRCTIPYYASAAAATAGRTRSSASSSMRALMLCLSALFCLLNSGFAFAAECRWGERRHCCAYDRAEQRGRKNQRSSSTAARRRRTGSRCCCYSSGSTDAEQDSSAALSRIQRGRCVESERETCRRREQSSRRTNAVKMKMETCKEYGDKNHKNGDDTDAEVVKRRTRQAATCICSQCRSRCGRISRRISSNISTKLSCNKSSSCSRNHHFFHYFYNFNINDLWRRWWIRGSHATRRPPSS